MQNEKSVARRTHLLLILAMLEIGAVKHGLRRASTKGIKIPKRQLKEIAGKLLAGQNLPGAIHLYGLAGVRPPKTVTDKDLKRLGRQAMKAMDYPTAFIAFKFAADKQGLIACGYHALNVNFFEAISPETAIEAFSEAGEPLPMDKFIATVTVLMFGGADEFQRGLRVLKRLGKCPKDLLLGAAMLQMSEGNLELARQAVAQLYPDPRLTLCMIAKKLLGEKPRHRYGCKRLLEACLLAIAQAGDPYPAELLVRFAEMCVTEGDPIAALMALEKANARPDTNRFLTIARTELKAGRPEVALHICRTLGVSVSFDDVWAYAKEELENRTRLYSTSQFFYGEDEMNKLFAHVAEFEELNQKIN